MEIESQFELFQKEISDDFELREEIRTTVRELEQKAREILTVMQKIHQANGVAKIGEFCGKSREFFGDVKKSYSNLAKKIPAKEYFKYHDNFRFVNQRLAQLAALIIYLESEKMASREEVAKMMGVAVKREDGFHLDLEDYLTGLLYLAGDLARFAVNCVTCGEYERPVKIAAFICELDSGFRLLNLKNDALRKKFDGLKYEVRKVEEVLYDLSIRGLKK